MPVRVLIVDDHAVVRQGLRIFLDMDDDIITVGEAANGAAAIKLAHELQPDVILMDLLMPIMDGITATTTIRRELPDIEIVALTSVLKKDLVVQAVQAGAIGYLLKDTEANRVCEAIRAAAGGEVRFSDEAAALLMQHVRLPRQTEHLTDRETEVLRLLAMGQSNKEISRSLQITESTVKSHVKSIMQKLNVPSRVHAAFHAVRMGLVSERVREPSR
jgi:two-component system, NarL family, response regulator LiaR